MTEYQLQVNPHNCVRAPARMNACVAVAMPLVQMCSQAPPPSSSNKFNHLQSDFEEKGAGRTGRCAAGTI